MFAVADMPVAELVEARVMLMGWRLAERASFGGRLSMQCLTQWGVRMRAVRIVSVNDRALILNWPFPPTSPLNNVFALSSSFADPCSSEQSIMRRPPMDVFSGLMDECNVTAFSITQPSCTLGVFAPVCFVGDRHDLCLSCDGFGSRWAAP
jgi:hypothetical protein